MIDKDRALADSVILSTQLQNRLDRVTDACKQVSLAVQRSGYRVPDSVKVAVMDMREELRELGYL